MKVKEIDRTANVAWSPSTQYPIYLAAATAAQQLDATFSTSAAVELYELNLGEPGLSMRSAGSMPSDCRFHKLVWGSHCSDKPDSPCGVLVGGAENGGVHVWNPQKLMDNEDPLVEKLDKHAGSVAALDINPFQGNLLATGASDSEIYIWDLNNSANPMTPGAKSQPPDDVTCLAWNKQVQHILASTYAGRCVVWDLRKNEPIIKVSDSMARIKCKLIAWHPEVATQMCLASEDDHTPVIQLWDLRFATSPLKSLENHQRGLLSMAWCPQDPDLLLSCGKDNRILCWNPNSAVQGGEVLYELPTSNQWSFDVQWCPRNPGVLSSCSFDGHISIYSLMGGREETPASPSASDISASFPGMDPFSQPMAQPQPTQQQGMALKKAPKWLRRPVGATFGFGGKLITFENVKPANPQVPVQRVVHVSQVVTETGLVTRSQQLEAALTNGNYADFCSHKASNTRDVAEQSIWNFMKVQFEKDARGHYLQLLGYNKNELQKKVEEATGVNSEASVNGGVSATELAEKMAMLDTKDTTLISSPGAEKEAPTFDLSDQVPNGSAEPGDGSAAFDQIATAVHEQDSRPDSPLPIAVDDDVEGLVTQALLVANFEAAVEVCLHHNKMAEAMILAIAGGADLLRRTQKRYFKSNRSNLGRLVSSLVTRDFEHIVRTCDLDNWREALGVALTYAQADEFASLCDILGSRLEFERSGDLASNAALCYICAGNVDKLVSWWNRFNGSQSPTALQDLVEKVMILRKAVEAASGQSHQVSTGPLAEKLSQYAGLLASQGSLGIAMNYLGDSQEASLVLLRDRLMTALGYQVTARPFQVVNVPAAGMKPQQPQQPAMSRGMTAQQPKTQQGGYLATANRNFQTTTTPSSTYYTNPSDHYGGMSASVQQPSTSTYSTPGGMGTATSGHSAITKGGLSGKYPAYPQTSTGYDPYSQTPYSQPGYNPTSNPYSTASSYSSPYMSNMPVNTSQAGPTAPTIFNTTSQTPGIWPCESAPSRRRESVYSNESETSSKSDKSGSPYVPQSSAPPPGMGVIQPTRPSFQEMKPTNAWNDPPAVTAKKKEQKYEAPAPITAPIYGVPQPDQGPPGAPNYAYNPQQTYQPPQQQQQQQQQPPSPLRAEPPKPVVKGPVPNEHIILQDIFNKLANQCLAAARNPQMRRKLEDVLRKLEILYDKLRESGLSPSVLAGLHQIVQSIQQYDYQTGLAYHTQLIGQGNFAEISAFMPGIKVLLQTAVQLQVYVQ